MHQNLVAGLRAGGHVLYVRHTATDGAQDDPTPDLTDPATQRGLSAAGRAQARQIGDAIERLRIPVGTVLVSPYARTRMTAELAFGRGRARPAKDLINEIYPGTDDEKLAQSLRRRLARPPSAGTNIALVSHGFNLRRATGLSTSEGDTVIFKPQDGAQYKLVATISVAQWRELAR